jgi:hypothetical protein
MQQPAGDFVLDLGWAPFRVPRGEVRGEPLAGQLPGLVREAQPLRARHGA